MKRINLFAPALLAAVALVPSLGAAPVPIVVGVGSSAQFKSAAIGAFLDLAGGGAAGAQHYTIKGNTPTGSNFVQMYDSRNAGIQLEGGNGWIVWNAAHTKVWAYLSVDSVVGNRGFFASPRAQIQFDPSVQTTPGQNLIQAALFGGYSDASAVPADIYAAINNAPFNAAFTDIRPEDAKFAQCRTASTLDSVDYTGLGYGTSAVADCYTTPTLIGTSILSQVSAGGSPQMKANPVAFNIYGSDPFTGDAIPPFTTIPIGAAPIIFIVNRQDTGSGGLGEPGGPTNVSLATIQKVYTSGAHCATNALGAAGTNQPLTVFNREPMSGTFNTTEFTNFRLTANGHTASMEFGVNPANPDSNPLDLACGPVGGTRERAIGTSEEVKGVQETPDSIGYVFFSYSNIAGIAGSPDWGYLEVQDVDPIQATYTGGELPTCAEPCPLPGGASFPNLRNGTYRTWSVLRVVTDSSGINYTHVHNLVIAAQGNVNSTAPDYVPFLPQSGGEPGLQLYRSHFMQAGFAPSNGLPNGVGVEKGGDMGGCIEPNGPAPGVLSCRQ
jgi:ABC-type phosphate transport system substrate-binding protein